MVTNRGHGLILLKQLLENGTVCHVMNDPDIRVTLNLLEGTFPYRSSDVLFCQQEQLFKMFIEINQYEFQTLSFVFSSLLALPFYYLEELAVEKNQTLLQTVGEDIVDEEVYSSLYNACIAIQHRQDRLKQKLVFQ